MGSLLRLVFATDGPVDRRIYVVVGATLMTARYLVDALFIYTTAGVVRTPSDYLAPLASLTLPSPGAMPRPAAALLLLWTLPFVWIGVAMSARRARDAGLPPWLAVAFFLPGLNYILILTLAVLPSVPPAVRQSIAAVEAAPAPFDRQELAAVLGGAGCAIGMVLVGVYALKVYGLTLFLGAPFALGLVTGWVANRDRARGRGRNAALPTLAVLLAAVALIGFALEGVVCLILSIPLALPLAYLVRPSAGTSRRSAGRCAAAWRCCSS